MVELVLRRDEVLELRSSSDPDLLWQSDLASGKYGHADFSDSGGDLGTGHPLETAIVMLLYSERAVPPVAGEFPRATARGGWAGNSFDVAEGEAELGSLLHTLENHPLDDETGLLAKAYAEEALQPLVDQGIAERITVAYAIDATAGRLELKIDLYGAAGQLVFAATYPLTG